MKLYNTKKTQNIQWKYTLNIYMPIDTLLHHSNCRVCKLYFNHKRVTVTIYKKLCYCRETARGATSVEIV